MTSNGRVARLTALALATGTLVAAGAGSAGAATTTKDVFTATGAGSVISLHLNLPAALPVIGSQITQDLVTTGSNVRTSGLTTPPAAAVSAILGSNGNVPVVSQVLEKSVSAQYGKNPSASDGTFPANPLLTGGVLQLVGQVSNPDVQGTTPVAHSKSAVVDLKLDAGQNLQAVLAALTSALQSNLTGVIGTLPNGSSAAPVAGVTTTVTDLINTLVNTIPTIPGTDANQQVKDQVAKLTSLLDALPQALSAKLAATTTDTSLLKIGLITSEQTVTHEAGIVTSHATNAIEKISLLGGLITLDSLTSDAVAGLGSGGAQTATASGTSSLLKLNVDGVLGLEINSQLQAILTSGVLPAQAVDAVNQALAQVTSTLKSALGASLVAPSQGTIVKTADKASAEESAARLVVQPAGFAQPIIDLGLVPAVATVEKGQAVTNITPIQTPANAVATPHFAATGADFPLTASVAVGLMGLAFVARRRRLAHLAG